MISVLPCLHTPESRYVRLAALTHDGGMASRTTVACIYHPKSQSACPRCRTSRRWRAKKEKKKNKKRKAKRPTKRRCVVMVGTPAGSARQRVRRRQLPSCLLQRQVDGVWRLLSPCRADVCKHVRRSERFPMRDRLHGISRKEETNEKRKPSSRPRQTSSSTPRRIDLACTPHTHTHTHTHAHTHTVANPENPHPQTVSVSACTTSIC
jgi:hypothetical protein